MGYHEPIAFKPYRFLILIFFICLTFVFGSCNQTTTGQDNNKNKDSIINSKAPQAKPKPVDPPESYVKSVMEEAEYIALINITSADSINQGIKVFNGKVLKSFKGKLKAGDLVSYFTINEMKHNGIHNDTLAVFLQRETEPEIIKGKNIYFNAVDNSSFEYTRFIDSLLTNK